jgi:exoribonuclease-2
METGNIVEYIDRQKIMCAVILEVKDKRLRILTENNRELNLSANRLSHRCAMRLDLSQGRHKAVEALKQIARRREALIGQVDIKELWDVLNSEQEWIDLETMTEFCFPNSPTDDHASAVIRAFFKDRLYFKFNPDRFYPYTQEQVEQILVQQREAERRNRIVEKGAEWLNRIFKNQSRPPAEFSEQQSEIVEILKSIYLYDKESEHYDLGKQMLNNAQLVELDEIFPTLVKIGVWSEHENTELIKLGVPVAFPQEVEAAAMQLAKVESHERISVQPGVSRLDLSGLPTMTIDGQATLDFDDAISLERDGDGFRLGVHIVDVGQFIRKEDPIDQEALSRASSIYMPDQRIPMLPNCLAEGLCSLKAGKLRPAITTLVKLSPALEIVSHEIIATWVRIERQLTYYDANLMAEENPDLIVLRDFAAKFRRFRLDSGAVQITLPEIHVWITADSEIAVNKVNRESPGRMLVSELMIMTNWLSAKQLAANRLPAIYHWLSAKQLAANRLPAIYRSQPEPKELLYSGEEFDLFKNIMQRRLLSRFILGTAPEHHSGLGLETYTTATSPIRKFCDLVTQRQVRAVLGLESPYTEEEIARIIQLLEQPMANVARLQQRRLRYWILKFMEKRIGSKQEAIVLNRRRKSYQVLLSDYMIECDLPLISGLDLKPEDLLQVTIQRVDARRDILQISIG